MKIVIQNFIEQFPSSSCGYLSLMLSMSKTTIKNLIKFIQKIHTTLLKPELLLCITNQHLEMNNISNIRFTYSMFISKNET